LAARNVLVQRNGSTDNDVQLKVADFGISFILDEGQETKVGLTYGARGGHV
jgi:hypothetical protein